jgi:lysophospholipase L1-like esterase
MGLRHPPLSPASRSGDPRILALGDSFTFGYGVDDDDAWCERLARLDPRLETVNMGLGGYGVDQAYLWYLRDGTALDHQMQLIVFLTDDFDRMRSDRFMGYGKPFLAVRADSLAVTNLPVPRTSWLTRRRALHADAVARLSLIRISRRLLGLDAPPAEESVAEEDRVLREVVSRVFADLRRVNEAKRSRLVLVFLPGAWDYMGDPETEAWRGFVGAEAARQGIPLVDLVEAIRHVPPTEVNRLYAPNAHFSVAGNEWAARALHDRLAPLLDSLAQAPTADGVQPR